MTQMSPIVYRTHLGRLLCPHPCFKVFSRNFQSFQKIGGTLGPSLCVPFALRDPVNLFSLFGVYDSTMGHVRRIARTRQTRWKRKEVAIGHVCSLITLDLRFASKLERIPIPLSRSLMHSKLWTSPEKIQFLLMGWHAQALGRIPMHIPTFCIG